jgi:hypothetical protein
MHNDLHARIIGGAAAIADGQDTSILGFLNAATSPFLILIDRIYLMSGSLSAVTGVGIQITLRRLASLSSGTAGILAPMQWGHSELAEATAALTIATGGTAGALTGGTVGFRNVNNDEIQLTGQDSRPERPLWMAPNEEAAIQIPRGQGFDIFQVTSSTAGAWTPEFHVRIRRVRAGL